MRSHSSLWFGLRDKNKRAQICSIRVTVMSLLSCFWKFNLIISSWHGGEICWLERNNWIAMLRVRSDRRFYRMLICSDLIFGRVQTFLGAPENQHWGNGRFANRRIPEISNRYRPRSWQVIRVKKLKSNFLDRKKNTAKKTMIKHEGVKEENRKKYGFLHLSLGTKFEHGKK